MQQIKIILLIISIAIFSYSCTFPIYHLAREGVSNVSIGKKMKLVPVFKRAYEKKDYDDTAWPWSPSLVMNYKEKAEVALEAIESLWPDGILFFIEYIRNEKKEYIWAANMMINSREEWDRQHKQYDMIIQHLIQYLNDNNVDVRLYVTKVICAMYSTSILSIEALKKAENDENFEIKEMAKSGLENIEKKINEKKEEERLEQERLKKKEEYILFIEENVKKMNSQIEIIDKNVKPIYMKSDYGMTIDEIKKGLNMPYEMGVSGIGEVALAYNVGYLFSKSRASNEDVFMLLIFTGGVLTEYRFRWLGQSRSVRRMDWLPFP